MHRLSIVLAVHNQEDILQECLERILFYTSGSFELLVYLDGCTDRSPQICKKIKNTSAGKKIKIFETNNVFETKLNNLGLETAGGDLICFMQGDMLIGEDAWNQRMAKPFRWDDIFAVTTRTAHDWIINRNSKDIFKNIQDYEPDQNVDWCDILLHVNHRDRSNTQRDEFVIKECVNRGPLLMKTSELKKMGGFDSAFSPQDMDDHDLCYRVRKKIQKKVGLFWVNTYSDVRWGATRKGGEKKWLFLANQKNTRTVWKRHRELILSPKIEEARRLV